MSKKTILSIGYIPNDWDGERISCGDPESSDLNEITVSISEESAIIEDQELAITSSDLWNSESKLWYSIAQEANQVFQTNEASIDALKVYDSWLYFKGEENLFSGAKVIFEEDAFGEFYNDDKKLNGYFYIRHQLEVIDDDDTEYLEEQGIAFK